MTCGCDHVWQDACLRDWVSTREGSGCSEAPLSPGVQLSRRTTDGRGYVRARGGKTVGGRLVWSYEHTKNRAYSEVCLP